MSITRQEIKGLKVGDKLTYTTGIDPAVRTIYFATKDNLNEHLFLATLDRCKAQSWVRKLNRATTKVVYWLV